MKKTTAFLLLFICIAFSCERDDLCPEDKPTTPSLVIEFRNVNNPNNIKLVPDLRVEDFNDNTRVLEDYNAVNSRQIIVPLKTDADVTKYRIYRDYNVTTDGEIEGNPDVITIEYSRNEIYVSRACGFKTVFENVELIIEQETPETDNWMDFVAPENDNQSVTNEDEIHFTIRH